MSVSATNDSNPTKSSFAEILPEGALVNIFRQLSARPLKRNWKSYVNSEDVLSLFLVGGTVSAATKKCFNAISLLQKHRLLPVHPGEMCKNILIMKHVQTEKDLDAYMQHYLRGCGETLYELHIRCKSSQSWVPVFASHVVDIKLLSLYDVEELFPLKDLLASCSRLESLEYRAEDLPAHQVSALAQHCAGLQQFSFWPENCKSSLLGMWKCLGPTLQHLETYTWFFHDVDKQNGENIMQTYCCGLKTLMVRDVQEVDLDIVTKACLKICSNLEFVRFEEEFSPEKLLEIATNCPRVRFDIPLSTKTCKKTLDMVGERVAILRLAQSCMTESIDDIDGLRSAAENCRNLSSLSINYAYGTAVGLLSALLGERRRNLKYLTLDMSSEEAGKLWDSDATKKIAQLLTEGAVNIQHFTYASPVHGLPDRAFKSFFDGTTCLETVHIRLARSFFDFQDCADLQNEEENRILCFLETIADCPSLLEVQVTEYKQSVDYIRLSSPLDSIAAVRKLRMNQVDVSVFNIECRR